jgi:hypothetical protein
LSDLALLGPGSRVLVAGARVTGRAIVAALADSGVQLWVCDDDPAAARAIGGATAVGTAEAQARAGDFDLVVTSPGFPPTAPVLAAAAAAGVPIWGDVELAWRLDAAGRYGPPRRWLVVTGTNGKTTTTSMLYDMLLADGRRAVLCGNIGEPVLDVLNRPASSCSGRRRCGRRQAWCSTSLRTTSTGTAVSRATRRQSRVLSTAGWRWWAWTTRRPPRCCRPPGRRSRSASGSASRASGNSACATAYWSTVPSPTT